MYKTYILSAKNGSNKAIVDDNNILICSDDEIPKDFKNAEVIINWDTRESFYGAYPKLYNAEKIIFQFGDNTIDMSDDTVVEEYKRQALDSENYRLCKTINDALIEYSVIRRMEDTRCMPSEIQLETTDICNAKCIMCSHFYRQGTHTVTKNKEILNAMSDVLPFIKTVYLHGNGEPFLVENIDEYISKIGAYGIRCTANTNLSILTDKNVKTINDYFSELNISIDAVSPEIYESIRRGLSFDNLVSNCKKLRKNCPGLYMRMWSVIMRQNIYSLSEMVKFAAQMQFDEIVFTELSSDERLKNSADVMRCYPQTAAMQIKKATKTAEKYGIRIYAPDYSSDFDEEAFDREHKLMKSMPLFYGEQYYENLLSEIKGKPENSVKQSTKIGDRSIPCLQGVSVSGICDWAVERPFVDLEGNVSVCCINQHFVLGNLFEQSFKEIWSGQAAMNFRRTFYGGRLPYFCSGCEFLLQNRLRFLNLCESSVDLHKKIRFGGS